MGRVEGLLRETLDPDLVVIGDMLADAEYGPGWLDAED